MRASIEEYKAVEAAALKFVKSVAEGNSKYARELFILLTKPSCSATSTGSWSTAASSSSTAMWTP